MEYGKGLVILGIMTAAGVTVFGAPPDAESPADKKQGDAAVTNSVAERTAWRDGDHFLASCIAIDNQEQVALSRWAQDKIQNAQAKEFAKMLVRDHSQFLTKLQRYAPEATKDHFLTSTQDQANRKAKGTIQQVAATSELIENSNLQFDLMQLHREMAEQCLADTKQMLTAKPEQEFDACFIGLQIARHAAMKSKLTVCQRHATGELKDLLTEASSTTSDHLEHAQKLMKQLAPEPTTEASTN